MWSFPTAELETVSTNPEMVPFSTSTHQTHSSEDLIVPSRYGFDKPNKKKDNFDHDPDTVSVDDHKGTPLRTGTQYWSPNFPGDGAITDPYVGEPAKPAPPK